MLIDNTGNPRICDFGLAHIFFDEPGSGLTTTTEHTGTERYLAPELVTDDADVHPTMASDVYALGCLGLDVGDSLASSHPSHDYADYLSPTALCPSQK